eukprot:299608_1
MKQNHNDNNHLSLSDQLYLIFAQQPDRSLTDETVFSILHSRFNTTTAKIHDIKAVRFIHTTKHGLLTMYLRYDDICPSGSECKLKGCARVHFICKHDICNRRPFNFIQWKCNQKHCDLLHVPPDKLTTIILGIILRVIKRNCRPPLHVNGYRITLHAFISQFRRFFKEGPMPNMNVNDWIRILGTYNKLYIDIQPEQQCRDLWSFHLINPQSPHGIIEMQTNIRFITEHTCKVSLLNKSRDCECNPSFLCPYFHHSSKLVTIVDHCYNCKYNKKCYQWHIFNTHELPQSLPLNANSWERSKEQVRDEWILQISAENANICIESIVAMDQNDMQSEIFETKPNEIQSIHCDDIKNDKPNICPSGPSKPPHKAIRNTPNEQTEEQKLCSKPNEVNENEYIHCGDIKNDTPNTYPLRPSKPPLSECNKQIAALFKEKHRSKPKEVNEIQCVHSDCAKNDENYVTKHLMKSCRLDINGILCLLSDDSMDSVIADCRFFVRVSYGNNSNTFRIGRINEIVYYKKKYYFHGSLTSKGFGISFGGLSSALRRKQFTKISNENFTDKEITEWVDRVKVAPTALPKEKELINISETLSVIRKAKQLLKIRKGYEQELYSSLLFQCDMNMRQFRNLQDRKKNLEESSTKFPHSLKVEQNLIEVNQRWDELDDEIQKILQKFVQNNFIEQLKKERRHEILYLMNNFGIYSYQTTIDVNAYDIEEKKSKILKNCTCLKCCP